LTRKILVLYENRKVHDRYWRNVLRQTANRKDRYILATTSNLSKAHVTRDIISSAIRAISVQRAIE